MKSVLNKYIYKDNLDGGKVLFECEAPDITSADKQFEKITGISSLKSGISVQIKYGDPYESPLS